MEKTHKIELLAEILDQDPEDIKEDMALEEIDEWDSLAILSFIAMMDEEFEKDVSRKEIQQLVTISDVLAMME